MHYHNIYKVVSQEEKQKIIIGIDVIGSGVCSVLEIYRRRFADEPIRKNGIVVFDYPFFFNFDTMTEESEG